MLLEASGCGAQLDLGAIPTPRGVDALRWLTAFPSFGFLLAVDGRNVAEVRARFEEVGVACEAVGELDDRGKLDLLYEGDRALYWDLGAAPLTGFGG
jgi:selenophosphate synthetase-related protein